MNEAVGQELRQAREARGLSLEQASNATHIRVHYLKALEAGDMDALPSLTQGRGFVRVYAGFLGLNMQKLAELANSESDSTSPQPEPVTIQAPQSEESQAAEAIFQAMGSRLRIQREQLGLSLEDVERHTHIRSHYLKSLEAGNLKGLPSPVQGRGMLKNYANFLGMDPEPLMLQFAEGLQTLLAARQAAQPDARTKPVKAASKAGYSGAAQDESRAADRAPARSSSKKLVRLQRLLSIDILAGGGIVIILLGFVIWGVWRIMAVPGAAQTVTPTAPSVSEVLAGAPTASPAPDLMETGISTPAPTLPLGVRATKPPEAGASGTQEITGTVTVQPTNNGTLQLYIVVRQRAWMKVTADDKIEFNDRVLPGSAYQFSGNQRIELVTGNGAALQVTFNQFDLGVLGEFGEVIFRVFTAEGVSTPTATITPTPAPATSTPTSGPTLSPTPTSTATKTP